MVPKPGEPGSETWPADGEAWQRGGANCWTTPTYDADLNLLYFNTGNPCPDFDGDVREGDNLYTDCVVAVDPDNGQIKSHYQYTPHDVWDYDSTMENILFEADGKKLLGHFDKNGYFFVLDRTDCSLERVVPFVDRITWGEIDASGKVTAKVYPDKEGDPVHFWPGTGRRQGMDARRVQPGHGAVLLSGPGHRRHRDQASPRVQGEHPVLGGGRRRRRRGHRRVDQRV